jgi:type III secretion protein L
LLINLVQVHPWYVVATEKICQPEEIASLKSVEELLSSCKTLAESINSAAAAEYAKARESGYADGIAAAKNAAVKECLALSESAAEYIRQFDKEILALVLQIVQNALPGLGQDRLLPSLAEQALAQVKIGRFLTLKCHPENLPALQPFVDRLETNNPQLEHLKILPDVALGKHECLVETNFGSVRADLEATIKLISMRLAQPTKSLPTVQLEEVES